MTQHLIDEKNLNQLFYQAHTYNQFNSEPVSEETIKQLYDLLKWGPTAMNCQPARFIFIKTAKTKERLKTCLSPGNVDKTMVAPVTVIVAADQRFYEHLPQQWTAYEVKSLFEGNKDLAEATARRNATLGGAYLIMAARSLGLDCGPMSGFDNAKVDEEFFPDGRFKSDFLVNLGYGADQGYYPRGPRLTFDQAAEIL